MLLSEIVAFYNQFESAPKVALMKLNADIELLEIMHLAENQKIIDTDCMATLAQARIQLLTSFDNANIVVNNLREQIKKLIAEKEIDLYQKNYQNYKIEGKAHKDHGYNSLEENLRFRDLVGNWKTISKDDRAKYEQKVNNIILNSQLDLSDTSINIIKGRVANYATWKYPASIFRPSLTPFVDIMLANDPLYLVDEHQDLLSTITTTFNTSYQNRLRKYIISDHSDNCILDKLPDNQFAFFLIYNYFNYKPCEIIRRYLEEIYQKLKPGGVVGMTFNNCDKSNAVKSAENSVCSYTPGHIVFGMAKNIGYQQIFYLDDPGASSWIELQKPGTLSSLRGGQTLAKINHK
jgi:hypothetical protein